MREVLHNLLYGVQLDNFTPLTFSDLLFCIVKFNVFVIVRNTIEFKFLWIFFQIFQILFQKWFFVLMCSYQCFVVFSLLCGSNKLSLIKHILHWIFFSLENSHKIAKLCHQKTLQVHRCSYLLPNVLFKLEMNIFNTKIQSRKSLPIKKFNWFQVLKPNISWNIYSSQNNCKF